MQGKTIALMILILSIHIRLAHNKTTGAWYSILDSKMLAPFSQI